MQGTALRDGARAVGVLHDLVAGQPHLGCEAAGEARLACARRSVEEDVHAALGVPGGQHGLEHFAVALRKRAIVRPGKRRLGALAIEARGEGSLVDIVKKAAVVLVEVKVVIQQPISLQPPLRFHRPGNIGDRPIEALRQKDDPAGEAVFTPVVPKVGMHFRVGDEEREQGDVALKV